MPDSETKTYLNDFDTPVEMPSAEVTTWMIEREAEIVAQRHGGLESFAAIAFQGDVIRAYDVLQIMYREGMIDRPHAERLTEPYRRGRRKPEGRLTEPGWEDYAEPLTQDDRDRTDRYFNAVDNITASWQHLIDAVNVELESERKNPAHPLYGVERQASMWQTGGMCMLIGWTYERDDVAYEVMLGEQDGPLAHDRAEASEFGGYCISVGSEQSQLEGEAPLIYAPMFSARKPEDDERAAKFLTAMATAMHRFAREQAEAGVIA